MGTAAATVAQTLPRLSSPILNINKFTGVVKMQTVFRKEKNSDNPYVMVNKGVANDERLSWQARGLMLHLLSLPDDWQIYESELVKRAPNGKSSLKSIIKELMGYGYIERTSLRTTKGQFNGYEYRVYEDCTRVRFSDNGLSDNGKPATTNNNLTNNKTTNTLPHSANDAYIFFSVLEEQDLVRQANTILETGREKITEENYQECLYQIEQAIEDHGIDDLNEFIRKYKKEKKQGRSVENFTKYLELYQRGVR